jgi:hypothetical protein
MPDLTAKPTVSIVVPFHNEEENITELYAQLHSVMEEVDWAYQFVFVDDAIGRCTISSRGKDHAKGRRQRDFPYRVFNCLPATCAWCCRRSRADESSG